MSAQLINIKEDLKKMDLTSLPTLKLLILRNAMLEPIAPYLTYHVAKVGYKLELIWGEYDTILQECLTPHAAIASGVDAVWMMPYLPNLSPALWQRFAQLNESQISEESDRVVNYIHQCLNGLRQFSTVPVIVSLFDQPAFAAWGVADHHMPSSQTLCVQRLNEAVIKAAAHFKSVYTLNLNQIAVRVGQKHMYDQRLWDMAKVPFTLAGFAEIASDLGTFIRALKGKNKKCLVLDCDNTLWGGIIGEDGLQGIRLGNKGNGEAYQRLQQAALNLYHRGVILALNSKNNEQDVWEVFERHPDMILQRKHIAASSINWTDKATNLRALAEELNIGLDSLVFIDDNEFEIEWVKAQVPEVVCIHLPKDQPNEYASIIERCGLFDSITLSDEDRKRGEMYAAEAQRKTLKNQFANIEEYLRSLEMEITVNLADEFSIPRISQQTQKTNQFNLTTRRYSEAEIQEFVKSDNHDVVYLKLTDRFGDYGIIGTAILNYTTDQAHIDTFLMSCRALGRRVEDVFLKLCLMRSQARGCKVAIGDFIASAKNQQVTDFYPRFKFQPTTPPERVTARYQYDLTNAPLSIAFEVAKIHCNFL